MKGAATRAAAARAVHAVVVDGRSLDTALATVENDVEPADQGLLRAICYGVLRHHWRLAANVDGLLSRPLKSRDRVLHSLLCAGVFQLTDLRVSPHAAVTLTVEAARQLGRPKAASLVNAVLRNFLRRKTEARADTDEAAVWNHPPWMIHRIRADWPDRWTGILDANNRQAPMWLRVNSKRSPAAAYLKRLSGDGSLMPGIDQAIRLDVPRPVGDLPGFDGGDVSVQDAAAQIAAPWLLRDGGRRLLDLCAAPGGKAAHLLELADAGTSLTAVEVDRVRAGRIAGTLTRLGLDARICVADAADTAGWWDGEAFDRVLLDAPCSASGVIRRHPDIKHLRRASDVKALATLQARLLDAAWRVLAPGGRLLYVTCSVFRDENDRAIAGFLERHQDAIANIVLPNNNIQALMVRSDHGFQVLPGSGDLDGFFFACLDKRD